MKILLFLALISSANAFDLKPDQQTPAENVNVELVNQHLQKNFFLKIFKNLILTGQVVKENDKLIDRKTYTNLKIEF